MFMYTIYLCNKLNFFTDTFSGYSKFESHISVALITGLATDIPVSPKGNHV